MADRPTGTVTFLFTDIEGSTKLAGAYPETWEAARARHHEILSAAIESNKGYVFQIIGDAFCAAFHTAGDALRAAAESQTTLNSESWGEVPIKVRMGIHTGRAVVQESGDYHGYLAMSRIQRLMSAGHGGQVLISAATQELLLEDLPKEVSLRALGEQRLKDLVRPEHVYQLVVPGLPVDFPPLKTLDLYRHNLPVQFTSFVGREKEMEEIKRVILTHRLVTLTGVGGTGKTRLSLQVGADLLEHFPQGVWFVELASLFDPGLIPQIILSTLGVPEQPGQATRQVLMDYLSGMDLLLMLDNCEHLIEACAQLADVLLHAAPGLKILATSREALGIAGETIHPVRSLSLPDTLHPSPQTLSQYDAVRLFIERAVAVQPDFHVTDQNAPAVAQICVRLDGIPLAIELAAARVKGLSAEQIASRLDDRFRLLTGGSRTAVPRHRTLEATIAWSYQLLSKEERRLLRHLSVFAGGWTLEAAEQVCADKDLDSTSTQIVDLLLNLIDKSLIVVETDQGEPRYRMLETIRQYAQERLAEAKESIRARDQHLEYFRDFARQAKSHLRGKAQLVWLKRLEIEHDNVRAALTWSLESSAIEAGLGLAADLAGDIGSFWLYLGHMRTGYEFLQQLLGKPYTPDQIQVFASGHLAAGTLAFWLGEQAMARRHAEYGESLWRRLGPGGKTGLAEVKNLQTIIQMLWDVEPELPRARQQYEENLKVFQEADDRWMCAHTVSFKGAALYRSGDLIGARQALEQSLALFQECGDDIRRAHMQQALALLEIEQGRYVEARQRLEDVLSWYRQTPLIFAGDVSSWMLGAIAVREADYARAKELYSECLLFDQRKGNQLAECLVGFADIAHAEKRFERAAQLVGAAEAEVETRQEPLEKIDQVELERLTSRLRAVLGDAEFEARAHQGRALRREQAIAFALEDADLPSGPTDSA